MPSLIHHPVQKAYFSTHRVYSRILAGHVETHERRSGTVGSNCVHMLLSLSPSILHILSTSSACLLDSPVLHCVCNHNWQESQFKGLALSSFVQISSSLEGFDFMLQNTEMADPTTTIKEEYWGKQSRREKCSQIASVLHKSLPDSR